MFLNHICTRWFSSFNTTHFCRYKRWTLVSSSFCLYRQYVLAYSQESSFQTAQSYPPSPSLVEQSNQIVLLYSQVRFTYRWCSCLSAGHKSFISKLFCIVLHLSHFFLNLGNFPLLYASHPFASLLLHHGMLSQIGLWYMLCIFPCARLFLCMYNVHLSQTCKYLAPPITLLPVVDSLL